MTEYENHKKIKIDNRNYMIESKSVGFKNVAQSENPKINISYRQDRISSPVANISDIQVPMSSPTANISDKKIELRKDFAALIDKKM